MSQPRRTPLLKSLRFQTLSYLLLLLLVVGVVSFVAGSRIMDQSLKAYEKDVATERFARITQGVELSLQAVQGSATDYAQWDDSFNFMQDGDTTYLEDNYYASALENLGVDFVLFIRSDGSVQTVVDGRNEEPVFGLAETSELAPVLTRFRDAKPTRDTPNGYYLTTLGGIPIALCYARIEPSEAGENPPHLGWLVMARILDDKGLQNLRQLTGANILLYPTAAQDKFPLPTGYLSASLTDQLGLSPLTLAADPPPTLSQQRITGQKMLAWNTVAMVVLAALIAVFLLDRLILCRLATFSRLAETHLDHKGDSSITWPVKGSDELDTLATSLNKMVESLKDAERKLRDDQMELLSTKQNLESANRLKDSFLATISHELRTPMNGIVGAQELLKSATPTAYQKECLDTLSDSSALMSSMVERILLFSELQSGTVKLQPTVVHLQHWVQRMQRVWASTIQSKQLQSKPVQFQVECDTLPEAWIKADTVKLDQFIQELLRNAEKFTQQGSITLRLSEQKLNDRWHLIVDVKDTGIGIPKHQQDAVMDMFRQTAARYTRSHGGLGIGLAITREIIRVLEGEWEFTSEEGQGTHIQARIPIVIAEAPATPAPAPVTSERPVMPRMSGPGRILLVEDNPVNQKIMIKILEMLGWPYQLAVNGQEAVDWAQRESFSIILMDCQMPVMDGLEATRLIRQGNNPNQFTPIIAVTANVSDLDRDNCMSVGMNAYLAKPVKPQHIHEAISHWAPPSDTGKREAV